MIFSVLNLTKSFLDYWFIKYFRAFLYNKITLGANSLLILNSGQIGDLVIASKILERSYIFENYSEIYFLIREEYIELFAAYTGRIQIISYKNKKYKYNILYRICFLNKLKKLGIEEVHNLTSARSTWNDSISLCISASKTVCYKNHWKKLKKVFPKITDELYSDVLDCPYNEYEKIDQTIKYFNLNNNIIATCERIFSRDKKFAKNYDVMISPISSSKTKDWNIDKFKELILIIAKRWRVLIIGSKNQKNDLNKLRDENENIDISSGETELSELFNLLSHTNLYLGLDSGISHIALKATKKNIILVGGGTYGMYFPMSGDNSTHYLTNKLSCFQCEWECEYNNNFCLSEINVNEVYNHIEQLLIT